MSSKNKLEPYGDLVFSPLNIEDVKSLTMNVSRSGYISIQVETTDYPYTSKREVEKEILYWIYETVKTPVACEITFSNPNAFS